MTPESIELVGRCGLFVSTCVYAMVLSSEENVKWVNANTWVSVVIGVLIIVAWRMVIPPRYGMSMLIDFAIAGSPMIYRSWWLSKKGW